MERFLAYNQRHVSLSEGARSFFLQYGELRSYPKESCFTRPDERRPYWCLVLEGLAYGYTLDGGGLRRIHWFALPGQGFAGVRHLYTPSHTGHFIQFGADSTVLRIPALRMREAKERFPEVSELLHIYKQHHIDRSELLRNVLQQPTAYARFSAFMEAFPQIARTVSAQHQADFINLSRSRFFEARREWLERGDG